MESIIFWVEIGYLWNLKSHTVIDYPAFLVYQVDLIFRVWNLKKFKSNVVGLSKERLYDMW